MIAASWLLTLAGTALIPLMYWHMLRGRPVPALVCSSAAAALFCASSVLGFTATGSLVQLSLAVVAGALAIFSLWLIWLLTRRRRKRALALAGAKTRAVLARMLAALKPQPAPRLAKAPAGAS